MKLAFISLGRLVRNRLASFAASSLSVFIFADAIAFVSTGLDNTTLRCFSSDSRMKLMPF